MKTITVEMKYGGQKMSEKNPIQRDGFAITLQCEANIVDGDHVMEIMWEQGVLNLLYRGGASVLNDKLGVGKSSEAEYSVERAKVVQKALAEWFFGGCKNRSGAALPGGLVVSVEVGKHDFAEGGKSVKGLYWKDAVELLGQVESSKKHEPSEWMARECGYAGPLHGEDGEFHPDAIKSMQKRIAAKHEEIKALTRASL